MFFFILFVSLIQQPVFAFNSNQNYVEYTSTEQDLYEFAARCAVSTVQTNLKQAGFHHLLVDQWRLREDPIKEAFYAAYSAFEKTKLFVFPGYYSWSPRSFNPRKPGPITGGATRKVINAEICDGSKYDTQICDKTKDHFTVESFLDISVHTQYSERRYIPTSYVYHCFRWPYFALKDVNKKMFVYSNFHDVSLEGLTAIRY